jgi:DNA-binding winged helix-turn-helix (wHTH) protein
VSVTESALEKRRRGPAFRVGEFRVDPGLDRIDGPAGGIGLEPRAMDLLLFLASRPGETLSKEELIDEVWAGAAVVEGVLPKAVSALRHALGDGAGEPRYILTIPRRGYRLIAAVAPIEKRASFTTAARAPGTPRRWSRKAVVATVALTGLLIMVLGVRARRYSPAESIVAPAATSTPPSVERVVLEARRLWTTRKADDVARALELLRRAADEAPDSAEVRGWLSIVTVREANYVGSAKESLARAEAAADEALRLDPASAIGHAAKGLVALNRRLALAEAVAEQRRAVALDPRLAVARQYLAEALSASSAYDEAVAEIEEALTLEPLSPVLHGVKGLVLLCADRPLGALEAFDRVLVLAPEFGWFHRYRAYALARLGRTAEAAAEMEQEIRVVGDSDAELAELHRRIERSGLPGYWSWRIERVQKLVEKGLTPRPTQIAEALAGVGRYDEALAELARAPAAGDGEYFLYFKESPAFDALRGDPEFVALYRR